MIVLFIYLLFLKGSLGVYTSQSFLISALPCTQDQKWQGALGVVRLPLADFDLQEAAQTRGMESPAWPG